MILKLRVNAYFSFMCAIAFKQYSFFSTDLSYEYLSRQPYLSVTDLNSEWVVHLWFQSFLFTHETEYVVCDWTCLLGEVGGNLGFFLGGSILGYVDAVMRTRWRK